MTRSSGIRWRGEDIASYRDYVFKAKEDVMQRLRDDLDSIAKNAALEIHQKMGTSGTETNPLGRFETHAMLTAISHDTRIEGDIMYARFGWVNGGIPYVKMQDLGTRQLRDQQNVDPFNKPGIGIPGVFALLEAFTKAEEEMKDRGL